MLQEDLDYLKKHREDRVGLSTTNAWGLDPIQLGQLLGLDRCVSIIQTPYRKRIKVILKDEKVERKLNLQEFKDEFNVNYSAYLRFQSYQSLKKTLGNCPWMIRYTAFGNTERRLYQNYQFEIEGGYVENLSIRWIDSGLGYGVFANESFEAGIYIGEFTGLVRQLHRVKPDQNEYCFHYPTRFFSWVYMAIDALDYGNETRFINHSDAPNLEPRCLLHGNLLHVAFFTKRVISVGEELTYNYGKDFWSKRTKITGKNDVVEKGIFG